LAVGEFAAHDTTQSDSLDHVLAIDDGDMRPCGPACGGMIQLSGLRGLVQNSRRMVPMSYARWDRFDVGNRRVGGCTRGVDSDSRVDVRLAGQPSRSDCNERSDHLEDSDRSKQRICPWPR